VATTPNISANAEEQPYPGYGLPSRSPMPKWKRATVGRDGTFAVAIDNGDQTESQHL